MPSNVSNHLQLFLITRFQLFSSSVLFKISSCIARTRAGSGLPFTHSETHCWSWKLWTKNRTAWTVFSRNQWDIWRWQLFVLLAILSTNQQTEVFLALPFRCWITVRGTVREGLGEIRTAWNRKHRKNICKRNWTEPGCLVETRLRPEILLNPMSSKTTGWCTVCVTGGHMLASIVVPAGASWLAGFWPWHILTPTLHCSYPSYA